MMIAVLCWSKAIKAAADWVGGPCLRALSPLSLSLCSGTSMFWQQQLISTSYTSYTLYDDCRRLLLIITLLGQCQQRRRHYCFSSIAHYSHQFNDCTIVSEWVSCTPITEQPIYGNWLLLLPMLMIAITAAEAAAVAGRRKWSTLVICMQAGANAGLMLLTRVGPMSCWCQCCYFCCCCLFADN